MNRCTKSLVMLSLGFTIATSFSGRVAGDGADRDYGTPFVPEGPMIIENPL